MNIPMSSATQAEFKATGTVKDTGGGDTLIPKLDAIYIYIYIYIYTHTYVYIHIYIYIYRERERDR